MSRIWFAITSIRTNDTHIFAILIDGGFLFVLLVTPHSNSLFPTEKVLIIPVPYINSFIQELQRYLEFFINELIYELDRIYPIKNKN